LVRQDRKGKDRKREPKRKKEKDLFKTTKKLVAQIVGSF